MSKLATTISRKSLIRANKSPDKVLSKVHELLKAKSEQFKPDLTVLELIKELCADLQLIIEVESQSLLGEDREQILETLEDIYSLAESGVVMKTHVEYLANLPKIAPTSTYVIDCTTIAAFKYYDLL